MIALTPRPFRLLVLGALLGTNLWATHTLAEPVSRDQLDAALPGLRSMAEAAVAAGQVPGLAIVVVHEGEVVFLEGFGKRAMDKPEAVDADTVFQLASMSKPISSTVVAALVSDGVVGWDSRVSDLAPQYQLHDAYPTAEVTVRDLFNHRSGLPGDAGNEIEDLGFDRETVMHRLRLVPPWVSFRGGYSYSNAGITMGALAAAAPTGKAWEQVAQEKLFGPLGMKTASYRHDDFVARPNRAALHVPVDGKWVAKLTRNADVQAPAGGASASARDLAAWLRLELGKGAFDGKKLIAPEALEATHQPLMARGPNPVTGAPEFYGLGWNVEYGRHGLTWGHAGAFSVGGRTLVTLWPDSNLGITILANAFPTGVPEGISDNFADLVFDGQPSRDYIAPWNATYEGLFGPAIAAMQATFGTPPSDATPALPASAYVGTYSNAYVGEAEIVAEGEGLAVVLGPDKQVRYPLTHFDRDTFLYYPAAEMPDFPLPATFRIGPDGRAAEVVLESLNGSGMGTLARQAE
jgi:CubicO group peptidase (beta-lactamase class C family)